MAAGNHIIRVVLVLLLSASASLAQGIVEGTVRDGHGAAVPNSAVSLQREDGKAVLESNTDAEGKFRFSALDAGEYMLKLDADGYYPSSFAFVLRARQPLSLNLDVDARKRSASEWKYSPNI